MTSAEYKPGETPETAPADKPKRTRRTKAQMHAERQANVAKRALPDASHPNDIGPETREPTQESKGQEKPDKYDIASKRRASSRKKFENSGFLQGQQLLAAQRPGFVRRWVNDEKGKLDRRQDQGYTFVGEGAENEPFEATSDDIGSRKSQRVGVTDDKQPLRAYLMEIPEDFYKQDQQEKARRTDAKTRSASTEATSDSPGSKAYIPEGGSQFKLE